MEKTFDRNKWLIQADDFAISPAVAYGIVDGIRKGLIRNTGVFMNMPWTQECIKMIQPYMDEIAFGIDLNITTGCPLCMPDAIPSIVRNDGTFYSSWESRKMDKESDGEFHTNIVDVRKEYEEQINQFIKVVGKRPDYLHAHAYTNQMIIELQHELAEQYRIPYSADVYQKLTGRNIFSGVCQWYEKPASFENQMSSSLKKYLLDNQNEILSHEYAMIIGHMGYVDQKLFELSSYNLYRLNDLAGVMDEEVKSMVQNSNVELITYKDLEI